MKNKKSLVLILIVCIIPLFAGLLLLSRLPEQIPVQWSSDGTVSNYAPRWFAVLGLPAFFALMSLFFYSKAERSELSIQYPESMKLFLKWSMPILAVVCTSLSYASVFGNSMVATGAAGFVGVSIIILGSYFYSLNNVTALRRVFLTNEDKSGDVYSRCGIIFVLVGIIASLFACIGNVILSFSFSVASIVISAVYSAITGR